MLTRLQCERVSSLFFFFQAEDGIRDLTVTGVQTCALPILCAGMVAYVTIPKEAEPDVKIPIIYVQLSQRGISPEDSERLLLRPVETQLKSVGNVKEMRSTAFEGGGFVLQIGRASCRERV